MWYGQRPSFYSVVWPEQGAAQGEIFEVSGRSATSASPGHARPLYFIVIASASAARLAAIAPRVSVLADRDEWVHQDYEKVMRDLTATHRLAHDLDVCLEQAREERADLIGQHAERDEAQADERAHLVAQDRPPAARDRAPRELFVVAQAAAAPRVACAQGKAALELTGSSVQRQDHRLMVRRLRVAVDANGGHARSQILAHENEVAVQLRLVAGSPFRRP